MGPDGVRGGAGHCGLWPLLATVVAFGWGEDGFGQATTKRPSAYNNTSCFGTPGVVQGSWVWKHWWDPHRAGGASWARGCCMSLLQTSWVDAASVLKVEPHG